MLFCWEAGCQTGRLGIQDPSKCVGKLWILTVPYSVQHETLEYRFTTNRLSDIELTGSSDMQAPPQGNGSQGAGRYTYDHVYNICIYKIYTHIYAQ